MKFDIAMAVMFAALAVRTYKPRGHLRRLSYQDDSFERDQYERERAQARAAAYRPPPPVEPQDFTGEDLSELTKRMSAEDAETLTLFHALNKDKEPEPEEITDLRNVGISRGWRPTSDTALPTLTGTVVREVPEEEWKAEELAEAWGPRGPSASYEEWKGETDADWEEPDLLRDGVDVTMRKLILKHFGVPALEQGIHA